jgi:cytoskeletal protein CcmA (bactofilin family)
MINTRNKSLLMRGSLLLLMLSMLFFPLAGSASAAEVIPGDPDAFVDADTVIEDDLFISGRHVQIDGTVLGDVFASGEDVQINGRIDGNLFVAGQSLIINGEVSDNVVSAAYSLQLGPDADISGNLYFAGFSLQAMEASQIARSVYAAGYQAALDGSIGRNVLASLSAFQLDGSVAGDVQLALNQSTGNIRNQFGDPTFYIPENVSVLPEGIFQGSNASILGEFEHSVNIFNIDSPNFDGDDVAGFFVTNWMRSRVGEFMALLILGLLLFTLVPGPGRRAVEQMRSQPLSSIAWGALISLAFPLLLVVSITLVIFLTIFFGAATLGSLAGTVLSLGGITVVSFWTLFGLLFWMISKIIFAYLIGHSLVERVSPEALDGRWGVLFALVPGILLYEFVRAIPLLGHLTALIVILMGVGAVFLVFRNAWRNRSQAAA